MIFLGIDGGGTKTEFVFCDETGRVLARSIQDSACHWQYESDKLEGVLKDGVGSLLSQTKMKATDITSVCFGMAGLGEDAVKDKISIKACEDYFKDTPLKIVNDVEAAYVGALGKKPGINIVAGTGTMAFGMDDSNKSARCGGWGHEIGDEGSGYWLGRKAVELFTKQADGRAVKSKLYELFRSKFKLDSDFEIMTIFQDEYFTDRTKTASLQMILLEAAKLGDISAVNAYKDAVDEMLMLADAIRNNLNFSNTVKLSYTGGLFNIKEFVLKPFIEQGQLNGFKVTAPLFSPIEGALIVAAENMGKHKQLMENISKGKQY